MAKTQPIHGATTGKTMYRVAASGWHCFLNVGAFDKIAVKIRGESAGGRAETRANCSEEITHGDVRERRAHTVLG